MKHFTKLALAGALAALTSGAVQAQELYTPNLAYRTGPFAATGIPLMNGQADYLAMLNARDGGIGGIMINAEECETGYSTEKGVECYEKTKSKAIVTQPWSTGITLQVLPKTNVDNIPILAPGYGFSPMMDGKTFQWAYNTPGGYWDAADMIIQFIEEQGDLKGKKVAFLHLDHPFGKEPLPVLEAAAEAKGFELNPIPVGLKEMQNQSAQWLQIRRMRPDYVIMWGWGAMNAGAITEAVKTKFPMENFLGVWWSGHDADLAIVGEAGKGYKSISWSYPNMDAPVMADIQKYVIDEGKSKTDDTEMKGVFYSRGIIISAILAEGIRVAQAEYGTPEINAEQLRWGLENLDMNEARLEELGLTGMVPPFSTSCDNHTGHAGGWMLEWDGEKFVKVSDLLTPNTDGYKALAAEKAKEYADANAPWPVNESCGG
ncbi:ABC transporter substrate-binding protein [Mameliella sediminis]|uniref:ABC transporter substrate-binding protein n=1 Tax=Mameliella sediminis TaxID=2836866 RepID=UPI001C4876E5|nr:ABC transporter substrate-binding protein [Mameliella sediminis]MBY6115111.1 ABC transporter substrate-binding protein [Antarctobacter heliothermus]MBY6145004.1 ABC transporter substrate-binding protein [Mameliella alba]MBV7396111.1 ABC transporter substrate-binding protein [Mameliella sediminis]MBY6160522.1 ABC transporter substrate-binding protein [Mameliella alba]MBY6168992.1 ABC transporter substrate-binding protein [Mameliella alba]